MKAVLTPLYQSDRRWSGLLLGHGPGTIGRAGCVLTSLVMAARVLGVRPLLIPPHANSQLLGAGAFDADSIIVERAAPVLGLAAGQHVVDHPGSVALVDELKRIFDPPPLQLDIVDGDGGAAVVTAADRAPACALLRVDHRGDGKGHHTVLAVELDRRSDTVFCLCPAVGRMALAWPTLRGTATWGQGDVRTYRVVGVRGLRHLST